MNLQSWNYRKMLLARRNEDSDFDRPELRVSKHLKSKNRI